MLHADIAPGRTRQSEKSRRRTGRPTETSVRWDGPHLHEGHDAFVLPLPLLPRRPPRLPHHDALAEPVALPQPGVVDPELPAEVPPARVGEAVAPHQHRVVLAHAGAHEPRRGVRVVVPRRQGDGEGHARGGAVQAELPGLVPAPAVGAAAARVPRGTGGGGREGREGRETARAEVHVRGERRNGRAARRRRPRDRAALTRR